MAVLTFPIEPDGDFCLACGRPMTEHRKHCEGDNVVGRDQHVIERRLRVARLQIGRRNKVTHIAKRTEERH